MSLGTQQRINPDLGGDAAEAPLDADAQYAKDFKGRPKDRRRSVALSKVPFVKQLSKMFSRDKDVGFMSEADIAKQQAESVTALRDRMRQNAVFYRQKLADVDQMVKVVKDHEETLKERVLASEESLEQFELFKKEMMGDFELQKHKARAPAAMPAAHTDTQWTAPLPLHSVPGARAAAAAQQLPVRSVPGAHLSRRGTVRARAAAAGAVGGRRRQLHDARAHARAGLRQPDRAVRAHPRQAAGGPHPHPSPNFNLHLTFT